MTGTEWHVITEDVPFRGIQACAQVFSSKEDAESYRDRVRARGGRAYGPIEKPALQAEEPVIMNYPLGPAIERPGWADHNPGQRALLSKSDAHYRKWRKFHSRKPVRIIRRNFEVETDR